MEALFIYVNLIMVMLVFPKRYQKEAVATLLHPCLCENLESLYHKAYYKAAREIKVKRGVVKDYRQGLYDIEDIFKGRFLNTLVCTFLSIRRGRLRISNVAEVTLMQLAN